MNTEAKSEMKTEADTTGPVRGFVIENFLFGRSDGISDTDSFMETGLVDSTGLIQLIAFLETTYGIEISDNELMPEHLDSIYNISGFLTKKLAG